MYKVQLRICFSILYCNQSKTQNETQKTNVMQNKMCVYYYPFDATSVALEKMSNTKISLSVEKCPGHFVVVVVVISVAIYILIKTKIEFTKVK